MIFFFESSAKGLSTTTTKHTHFIYPARCLQSA